MKKRSVKKVLIERERERDELSLAAIVSGIQTDNKRLKRTLQVLCIGFSGVVIIMIGVIAMVSNNKPVESATTPGTCLPIDKGGTGCDYSTLRDAMGLGNSTDVLSVDNGGTGASSVTAARINLGITPTVLYSNATGSTGDITLSDSAANYRYLEIFFSPDVISTSQDATFSSVKIPNPNGKYADLHNIRSTYAVANTIQAVFKNVFINGNTITNIKYGYFNIPQGANVTVANASAATQAIKIYEVIGYKQ